jgi:hypothetical protein
MAGGPAKNSTSGENACEKDIAEEMRGSESCCEELFRIETDFQT